MTKLRGFRIRRILRAINKRIFQSKRREQRRRLRQAVREQEALERSISDLGKSARITRESIWFGPANSAGQATAWSKALQVRGISATSFRITNDPVGEMFVAEEDAPRLTWVKIDYRVELAKKIMREYSTVFIESLRPIFALRALRDFTAERALEDLLLLKRGKKHVGVIFHGSDIRDIEFHAKTNPYSPFGDAVEELARVRERAEQARAMLPVLRRNRIPMLVTSPDLFHEVPDAIWLPIVIDYQIFNQVYQSAPPFQHEGPPKVLYLPSRSWVKSAHVIEPILEKLHSEGVIDRIHSDRVAHDQVPGLISQCDILIDQFLGIVGVLPLEAMAAGRVVLSHIEDWAYARLEERPPIVEVTPDTLEEVLRAFQPDKTRIALGRSYVQRWHDGSKSSEILLSATTFRKRRGMIFWQWSNPRRVV